MARPTASSLSLFSVTEKETTSPRTRLRRWSAEICRRSSTSLTTEGSAAGAGPAATSSARRLIPRRPSARPRLDELIAAIIAHSETMGTRRRASCPLLPYGDVEPQVRRPPPRTGARPAAHPLRSSGPAPGRGDDRAQWQREDQGRRGPGHAGLHVGDVPLPRPL